MADGCRSYGDARQQAPAAIAPSQAPVKRPRSDHGEIPGGSEHVGHYPHEEGRARHHIRDTESISASYDRYLRERGIVFYTGGGSFRPVAASTGESFRPVAASAGESFRPVAAGAGESFGPVAVGMGGHPVEDMRMMGVGGMDGRSIGYGSGKPEIPLPPFASNTLFVEGLPADCTHREVCHIFRPFAGFQEIRLVNKESRYPGGDPLVLCFVDFSNPSQATVALDALQGYKFDERDPDSANLRLQFARFSGPRSAGRPRGGR